MSIRYYDPEKVRWLGKEATEEEALKSSVHDHFWRYVAIMTNGFEYSAFDITSQEGKDAIADKRVNPGYKYIDFFKIPFRYSHFFFGEFAYKNPCLP